MTYVLSYNQNDLKIFSISFSNTNKNSIFLFSYDDDKKGPYLYDMTKQGIIPKKTATNSIFGINTVHIERGNNQKIW